MRTVQKDSKTKAKILEAAEKLMLSKGYTATSVDDICRQAKVTKGSFFYYFVSKEDLGKSALGRFCCNVRSKMQDGCYLAPGGSDPLKRVYAHVDFAIKMSKKNFENSGCLLGIFAQELADTHPQIRSLCADSFNEWAKIFTKDLKEAKEKYVPRSSIDAQSLAEHFIVILEGAQMLARVKRDQRIMGKNLGHFRQYLKSIFGR